MEVDGRVALVTGANLGIGAATLKSYVEPMLTRSLCSP
jgi:NAD(P)-dependent dehydrogenase (short-subunit alcohol dehydrogenase family)